MDKVEKFLRKIDVKFRKRLLHVLAELSAGNVEDLNIKPLKGMKNMYRCRIGNIRILFMRNKGKNIVFNIEFRGSAYKK